MTNRLSYYVSVKNAADLTCLSISTIYAYLTKGLIEGAEKFEGTRWIIPRKWCNDYAEGKIEIKGAFRGRYGQYGQKYYNARKRDRAEGD